MEAFRQDRRLIMLARLHYIATRHFTDTNALHFHLFRAFARFFIRVTIATGRFYQIEVTGIHAALRRFHRNGHLLANVTLRLLEMHMVFFWLFRLFQITLRCQGGQFRFHRLVTGLLGGAHNFLNFVRAFTSFVSTVHRTIVDRRIRAQRGTIRHHGTLFHLLGLGALLLIVVFVVAWHPLRFSTATIRLASFYFQIELGHGHRVATSGTTRHLVRALDFLCVGKRHNRTFKGRFALNVRTFGATFAHDAAGRQRFQRA